MYSCQIFENLFQLFNISKSNTLTGLKQKLEYPSYFMHINIYFIQGWLWYLQYFDNTYNTH